MPTITDIKKAIVIAEKIEKLQNEVQILEAELKELLGVITTTSAPAAPAAAKKATEKKKRKISAAGRARIIAAQKARWAKVKKGKAPVASKAAPVKAAGKKKRTISAEARKLMAAAAKARWADAKASGRKTLKK